ncbi:MFS transporter [Schaalia hyovaginalis]|uniref:MFS transporter n=1 Tax=Schaalia hyovaginalis TaxID=29316 RepID=UPI0026F202BB|nr:MFS transporter [Schaalia hyovaginalis]MCI6556283.1 MFS transporter [Schaalia hyovaginalis]
MLSPYLEVLRINGSWRFSLAGLILRLPMSMIGISIILLIKASYGNYSLAGLVSALNIIATALCAPTIARYVDRLGQRRVMLPLLMIGIGANAAFLLSAIAHASPVLVAIFSIVAGAAWGAPGAFVRARWANALKERPKDLTTAYAFESAIDELVYIVGPVLSTVLGTAFHPGVGFVLICLFLTLGGLWFFSQRSSEPAPRPGSEALRHRSVLRNPAVIVMVLTYIAMGSMFGANDVAVVEFAAALGAPSMSGVLLAFFSVGSLVAGLWYGSRTWTQPLWRLFAYGVILLAIGTSTYLLAHSLLVMAIVMTLTGIACAPTMTNVNTIIARVVDADRLTEGLTWVGTSLNIGLSLGSAAAGPAIDAGGAHGGYLVMVGAAWAMAVIMILGLPVLRRAVPLLHPRSGE